MSHAAGITTELARNRFAGEPLDRMRSLSGSELGTDGCVSNEVVARLAIRRFAECIGDDNPPWTDPHYPRSSPHGALIGVAPRSFQRFSLTAR